MSSATLTRFPRQLPAVSGARKNGLMRNQIIFTVTHGNNLYPSRSVLKPIPSSYYPYHSFSTMAAAKTKTVAVLGGSYGGYRAATLLGQELPQGWRVVMVDRNS